MGNKFMFSQDWFSHNIPLLHRALARFSEKAVQGLEIGSYEGRSTVWLMENILKHPHSDMTVIDTFMGSAEHADVPPDLRRKFDENVSAFKDRIRVLEGPSRTHLRSLPFDRYEFIYIDGSHVAADVLSDAVLSWPLLRHGGILIFDDYRWGADLPELMKPGIAIRAFMSVFESQYAVVSDQYQMIISKL